MHFDLFHNKVVKYNSSAMHNHRPSVAALVPRRCLAALNLLTAAAACLSLISITICSAQTPPPLKFASSSDYTASGRSITNSYHAGVRIAFDEINANGGYNGRRLDFITMDDGYVASRTRANVETLYNAHPDLIAFVAGLGTANTLASIPFAANRSIGLFFPATGAESLRNPFVRVVPNLVASYSSEAAFGVKYATQVLKLNRISLIFQNDAFGEPPTTLARNKLRDMGITPFTVASYPTGSMNMTGAVESLFSKEWLPQAVLMYTFGPQTAMIIRDYQARTRYPTKFILMSVADFVNLRSIMGSSGVYENVYLIRSAPDPNDNSFLISQRFNAAANLYNATVYREHYTMLGYMAGHLVHQVLTRHDSRTNVTSASFLNTLYSTNVFNVFGLTVGPYSDAAQGSCNQGLRQLWLSQATSTGWRAVTNEPGLGALLEPWPSMCVYQDKKARLPSIWGLGIAPQDTSPMAKDFVAGVKASVRYFNEIEGGGLAQLVVHAEDVDWKGTKVSSVNPFFTGTAAPAPSSAIQRFLNEYRVAGLIGSSHLSVAGGTTTGQVSELLSDLQGRPVVGVLGGDSPFYDTPPTHRLSHIAHPTRRISLACSTHSTSGATSSASASFALPAMVNNLFASAPKRGKHLILSTWCLRLQESFCLRHRHRCWRRR
ncbi:periplasmic binding protein-like I [Catenaria anguillulae PL171]|uniref:Periplasmic binding protein-like I n=1 Tax=Catenaria anguillulae PL171 TaxID=765915 RepID=A0A1Y2I4E5_9FUNG|nr:periplasmic binding protein-like I [Catenaria anguillulae PL171]